MSLAVSPASLPGVASGGTYSETISASGGTAPYTFAVTSGVVPSGLSLNGTTGVISGTAGAAGVYTFTITATDSLSATGSQVYTVVVAAITISPTSLPNAGVNNPYSQTIAASGGTAPYAYTVSAGVLPAGFALDGATGILSGTTSALGTFAFTIEATDATGAFVQQAYSLFVSAVVYWFVCTTSPRVETVPHNALDFNRRASKAIAALARSKSEVGHLIARPTPDPINYHLLCDGSAVSRSAFPQLFDAIGTAWGVGDGATTFNIPNLVTSPFPQATASPPQTITNTTVSTNNTVSEPSGDGETGGSSGGNFGSGGRTLDESLA